MKNPGMISITVHTNYERVSDGNPVYGCQLRFGRYKPRSLPGNRENSKLNVLPSFSVYGGSQNTPVVLFKLAQNKKRSKSWTVASHSQTRRTSAVEWWNYLQEKTNYITSTARIDLEKNTDSSPRRERKFTLIIVGSSRERLWMNIWQTLRLVRVRARTPIKCSDTESRVADNQWRARAFQVLLRHLSTEWRTEDLCITTDYVAYWSDSQIWKKGVAQSNDETHSHILMNINLEYLSEILNVSQGFC